MKKALFVSSIAISLLAATPMSSFATEKTELSKQDNFKENDFVVSKSMTKTEIIKDLAQKENITLDQAQEKLFSNTSLQARSVMPNNNLSNSNQESAEFVVMSARLQDRTIFNNVGYGDVYFYCQTTESGAFRAIKKIKYAGYKSGSKIFGGTLQYALPDPNRIHFTLNGHLYHSATTTYTSGGEIGVGGLASATINVSSSSNYFKPIFINRDVRF